MSLKTWSSGRPKPCEEIWVDDLIIEKCLRSEIRDLAGLPWYGCYVQKLKQKYTVLIIEHDDNMSRYTIRRLSNDNCKKKYICSMRFILNLLICSITFPCPCLFGRGFTSTLLLTVFMYCTYNYLSKRRAGACINKRYNTQCVTRTTSQQKNQQTKMNKHQVRSP